MDGHCRRRAGRRGRWCSMPWVCASCSTAAALRISRSSSPESTRVARIARDREAQRAQAPPAPAPAPEAPAAPAAPEPQPVPVANVTAAAPAARGVGILDGLPRPEPRRTLSGASDPHAMAGRRVEADLETADRRRLRVVRHRGRPRLHHRAARAAGDGRGVRRRHRPRAVDQRVDRDVPRVDGRRRSARDADLGRRARVRARRPRRAAMPGRRGRNGRVANEHPRRQRRLESPMGHVGRTPRRRRHHRRPARRTEGTIRRGVRSAHRETRVVGAERPAGVFVPDAGHARGRPADSGLQRLAAHGPDARSRRRAVGVPVEDGLTTSTRASRS